MLSRHNERNVCSGGGGGGGGGIGGGSDPDGTYACCINIGVPSFRYGESRSNRSHNKEVINENTGLDKSIL